MDAAPWDTRVGKLQYIHVMNEVEKLAQTVGGTQTRNKWAALSRVMPKGRQRPCGKAMA